MSVNKFTSSSPFELTDNQLTPFVADNLETITHPEISVNYMDCELSKEPDKDTNLTLEKTTTSYFDGSFESMVEIENIVDNALSEAQWNALPYYAERADLWIDDLLGAVLSLMQSNRYKRLPKLIHEAIELARTRVVVEANAKVVSLSDFKLSRSIIQKSAQDIPSHIDFYGIDHAERERGDPLTKKQEHAIHSALDYVKRKAPSMRLDYEELFQWLYYQAVNPSLQFEGCCFRKMMKTAVKLILGSRYRRPKGFALWYGELSA